MDMTGPRKQAKRYKWRFIAMIIAGEYFGGETAVPLISIGEWGPQY